MPVTLITETLANSNVGPKESAADPKVVIGFIALVVSLLWNWYNTARTTRITKQLRTQDFAADAFAEDVSEPLREQCRKLTAFVPQLRAAYTLSEEETRAELERINKEAASVLTGLSQEAERADGLSECCNWQNLVDEFEDIILTAFDGVLNPVNSPDRSSKAREELISRINKLDVAIRKKTTEERRRLKGL